MADKSDQQKYDTPRNSPRAVAALDVEVEVEYEGGVYQTFDTDVSKPLNAPQRKIQLHEVDVVAIRTRCHKMVLNPCGVCEYSYSVSVLP